MVTVGMSYQVLPGKEEHFEKVFQAIQKVLGNNPQHVDTRLFRECGASDYLIVSEWQEREAFESFASSDVFQKVVGWGRDQILRGRPTHDIYERSTSTQPKATEPEEWAANDDPAGEAAKLGGCPFHAANLEAEASH